MRTLGIDLASKPKKTAACVIEWHADVATVTDLRVGVSDPDILTLAVDLKGANAAGGVDYAIGIDAPFGWPIPFIEFVSRSPASSEPLPPFTPDFALKLKYRLTDLQVIECLHLFPLAVAADKIALPAMRCAGLLDALGVVDRSGVNGVFEVYPAAALKVWGPDLNEGTPLPLGVPLATLALGLRKACPWLCFKNPGAETLLAGNRDAFDAVIASLVARAAALGRTLCPDDDDMNRAKVEGWIAFPRKNCAIGDLLA